jgi:hypothetical protein
VEPLTDALMQQVDELVPSATGSPRLEWGNPLLLTTPTSIAIRDLAMRVEALEKALREISGAEPRETSGV